MSDEATSPYAELGAQSRQAVTDAVEAWTTTVQEAFANVPTSPSQVDLADSVDRMYDFTEKILELQRDFTKKLIAASNASAETAMASFTEASKPDDSRA